MKTACFAKITTTKKRTNFNQNNEMNVVNSEKTKKHSVADEMLKWAELLEKGLITNEEFERQKRKLMY